MKRYIKEFSALSDQELKLIKQQFPTGFDKRDYHVLKTHDGRSFEALEVRGPKAIYIVKVSQELIAHLDDEQWSMSDNEILNSLGTFD